MMNTLFNDGAGNLPFVSAASGDIELRDRIWSWDLSSVRGRTAARVGWDLPYSLDVETEYRRFIFISAKYRSERLGMGGPVDEIWHDHILDTYAYSEFCRSIAGRFLHHAPSFAEGRDNSRYSRTIDLVQLHFGEVNWRIWPKVEAGLTNCCSHCSRLTN